MARFVETLKSSGREYLLAGIKAGWEVTMGWNFFYYPNGNALRNAAPAQDPTSGLASALQVGYNAVCAAGLACEGALREEHIDRIVSGFVEALANEMINHGIRNGWW